MKFIAFFALLWAFAYSATCPCTNTSLCNPITEPMTRKELFVFQYEIEGWKNYDWSYVTTLATFGNFDPQMVCTAHANNARVVFGMSFFASQLNNQTAKSEFIMQQYQRVVDSFADGINVDIEDALDASHAPLLTEFVANITSFFHSKLPNSQVTFDVSWTPNCFDERCYDYAGLAQNTDFLVMMDYDMRNQIFGPCIASANSQPNLIQEGIVNYTKLGISTDKLVMGLPWYGKDYPCVELSENGQICSIYPIPYRGASCSDNIAWGKSYSDIKTLLLENSTTGYQWDSTLQSPWFNYFNHETSDWRQVWFDDPTSLKIKTTMAKEMNLKGVGVWTGDFVEYAEDPLSASQLWEAMEYFFI